MIRKCDFQMQFRVGGELASVKTQEPAPYALAGQHRSCAAIWPCRPSALLALLPPPRGAVANRSHDFLCVFPFHPPSLFRGELFRDGLSGRCT